jgi:hypothetical protein
VPLPRQALTTETRSNNKTRFLKQAAYDQYIVFQPNVSKLNQNPKNLKVSKEILTLLDTTQVHTILINLHESLVLFFEPETIFKTLIKFKYRNGSFLALQATSLPSIRITRFQSQQLKTIKKKGLRS